MNGKNTKNIEKNGICLNGLKKIYFCSQIFDCEYMKKIIMMVALLTMTIFVISSCSYQCECTLYENGQVVGVSTEVTHGTSCEELSSFTETPFGKMGLECVEKASGF